MRSIPLDRTFQGIPPLNAIAATSDPIERAVQLGKLARATGTLPSEYAQLRVSSLLEALTNRRAREVADLVGLSTSRISQLTRRARLAGVAS